MENNGTYSWSPNQPSKKPVDWKKIRNILLTVVVAIALLLAAGSCFYTVDDKQQAVVTTFGKVTEEEKIGLERAREQIYHAALGLQQSARMRLDMVAAELKGELRMFLESRRSALQAAEAVAQAFDPRKLLAMGFAVVRSEGKAVKSSAGMAGRKVEIELHDGVLKANVE